MEQTFTILILSVGLFLSLIYIGVLFNKNSKLKSEIDGMKNTVSEKVNQLERQIKAQEQLANDLVSIDPGDRAIIPNYGLTYNEKEDFKVTYEVEILEVSIDKVKVKAIDFTSTDRVGRDPQRRQGILDFMNGKWMKKKEIELVVDDQMRRDKKLNQIFN